MAYRLGDLEGARYHLERGVSLYDAAAHGDNARLYGQDSCLTNLVYLGWVLWLLGFSDQAREAQRRATELAERHDRPFEVAWAYVFQAYLFANHREWPSCLAAACKVIAVCKEHGYGFWLAFGRCYAGIARTHTERSTSGGDDTLQQIQFLRSVGAEVSQPAILALLADGALALDRVDDGLARVETGLEIAERTSERFAESELLQIRAELLLKRGQDFQSQAEACLTQAIEVARRHKAKAIELRASASLARLWQAQGKHQAAHDLLAGVYGWFTEGFDTRDLMDAKALLDGLISTSG